MDVGRFSDLSDMHTKFQNSEEFGNKLDFMQYAKFIYLTLAISTIFHLFLPY